MIEVQRSYLRHGFGLENVDLISETKATIPVVSPDIDHAFSIEGYTVLLARSYLHNLLAVELFHVD